MKTINVKQPDRRERNREAMIIKPVGRYAQLSVIALLTGMQLACTEKPEEPGPDAQPSTEETSFEDVKAEAAELVETIKDYSVDQRDQAIREIDAALDELDRRLDTLNTRIEDNSESMDEAAREKVRARQEALRKQRQKLAESYDRLKTDTDDAWEQVKIGFSKAYDDIRIALEKAEREFESDQPPESDK